LASLFIEACNAYRFVMRLPKAILLDRDGVINFDSPDYILTPEQWRPIPGSLEAIARLNRSGIPVAIVSNQSALGRGMMDRQTFDAIHARMIAAIEEQGGRIAHVAYCPHAPEDNCDCRKPRPGLILDTLTRLGLSDQPSSVLLVGDSVRDVEAAVAARVRPILVRTGYGDAEEIYRQARRLDQDLQIYPDLRTVVDTLLGET
jgi:D-glycero-D-manno-heptose 1,7-bisphosphate phosphatase